MESSILIAIISMGGLGFIFAGALAVADRKLRVYEDPKIALINDVLPNANCGACGNAGCYDFAVNVIAGTAKIDGCPVGGQDVVDEISAILGIESTSAVKMVARILCKGGNAEAERKNVHYTGPSNCVVEALVSGGEKLCLYGCLGGGDCVSACQFNALYMNDNNLPEVIDELCTGCGLCVKACPRGVIEIHPAERNVFVFCKNLDDPKTSKKVCKVACIGCSICARKSDGGVIMKDNLAIINYDKLDMSKVPLDKCSTNAIGYYRTSGEEVKEIEIKEDITA
jgi:Na+-translocating ferredoxin:NAD+ oxidoreductase subunit B